MKKFEKLNSIAVPWLVPNVDTDTITPMKRLILNNDCMEKFSFEPYRFINGDGDKGELNMDFPLNQPQYAGAKIMICGDNFGCGSSRETAPEAIARLGICCLIGTSYAGIFNKNCYQQGILPLVFPKETVEDLARQAEKLGSFAVDLEKQEVIAPDGTVLPFTIDEKRKMCLLEGLDDVSFTLRHKDEILNWFEKDAAAHPFYYLG